MIHFTFIVANEPADRDGARNEEESAITIKIRKGNTHKYTE